MAKKNSETISPDLAAAIVKQYILPMFEAGAKREQKLKYNKISSIAQSGKLFSPKD